MFVCVLSCVVHRHDLFMSHLLFLLCPRVSIVSHSSIPCLWTLCELVFACTITSGGISDTCFIISNSMFKMFCFCFVLQTVCVCFRLAMLRSRESPLIVCCLL